MFTYLVTCFIVCSCPILTEGVINATTISANEINMYNNNVRPVKYPNDVVIVTAKFYLIAIEEVDFHKQHVSLRGFFELEWMDVFAHLLKEWQWMNDDQLSLDAELIWLPDLRVGNDAGFGNILDRKDYGKVIVDGSGAVAGFPYVTRQITFACDVTFYPFDKQEVYITLISWSLASNKLILVPKGDFYQSALEQFTENGEWDVTDRQLIQEYIQSDNKSYASLAYKITICRKWLHPVLNTIGPIVLTSVLNTLVFVLPIESGERITLSISVFIILALFLTIINDSLPKTSINVSILVVYLSLQIIGTVLTLVTTCVIAAVYHRDHHDSKSSFNSLLCMTKTDDQAKNARPDNQHGKILAGRLDTLFLWLSITWNIALLGMVVAAITG